MTTFFHPHFRTLLVIAAVGWWLASCGKGGIPLTSLPGSTRTEEIPKFAFDYMQSKARLRYTGEDIEGDIKVHLRIRQDSLIWMAYTLVGIQGGKALIDQKTIKLVNHMKKKYSVIPFTELSKQFKVPMNYSLIQAALIGDWTQIPLHDRTSRTYPNEKKITGFVDSLEITYSISLTLLRTTRAKLVDQRSGTTVQFEYDQFRQTQQQKTQEQIAPYSAKIKVLYKKDSLAPQNMKIELNYSKIEIDKHPLRFPFNIPGRYEKK